MRRLETKQGKSIKNWVTKEITVYSKEDRLLKGIDQNIRETWPDLEMYFTMSGTLISLHP